MTINNPTTVYTAFFDPEDNGIAGSILFRGTKNGQGVMVRVNLDSLPAGAGPFGYHVCSKLNILKMFFITKRLVS